MKVKMVATAKQLYQGQQLYPGKAFDADESDVEDLIAVNFSRMAESELEEHSAVMKTTAPTGGNNGGTRKRGGYHRADMKADDE